MATKTAKRPKLTIIKEKQLDMFPFTSLEVYTLTALHKGKVVEDAPQNGFYWKDNANITGVGPFDGSMAAVEHWKSLQLNHRAITNMEPDGVTPRSGNVIQASDRFKNKKSK